ncbi:YidC/Oxa1 family membrane protein insertase [Streptomyces sp. NPDC093707]|uniref:YidC/Oxa1 family membrane protein insertase n=1 Tax=Streptomyces sp. NPDC093707 TaxID=3154984 RepID=UPI00344B7DC1
MSVFGILGEALARGAEVIEPLFGTAATAAAIVLFTLGVRAALHPLARAAARGEKARSALAPHVAALQRKYRGDRERLQQAMADLYAENGSSPLAGCLPMLIQLPVFFVMYHLFSTGNGTLLSHTLLGAPLGGTWRQALADGGVAGPRGLVYLALFAVIAAVATWNYRRARATMAAAPTAAADTAAPGTGAMTTMNKLMPLLSFGTLITLAVVPLAAGLYVVTTTTWTACERALLHRDRTPASRHKADEDRNQHGDQDREPTGIRRWLPARKPLREAAVASGIASAGESARRTHAAADDVQVPQTAQGEAASSSPQPAVRRSGPKTRAARQKAARARANTAARKGGPGKPTGSDRSGKGADPVVPTPR